MPLYDYDCAACGRRFEVIHGVHADPPASCPLCGSGPVKKAISAANVHYKGSGWAKKERRTAVKAGSSTGSGDDGSSDGATAPDKASPVDRDSSDSGASPVPAAGDSGDRASGGGDRASGGGDRASGGGDRASGGPARPSKSGASSKARHTTTD